MKRILLVVLLVATPAFARVLSYAPVSQTLGGRASQSRTTRHFLLLEGARAQGDPLAFGSAEVVLYDSTGAEAPRVVYSTSYVVGAALFQERPDRAPMILVAEQRGPVYRTLLSTDGGNRWTEVLELNRLLLAQTKPEDSGGPFTHGLAAPIQPASAQFPFVAAFGSGIYAISATGTAVRIGEGRLAGQNRAGTQFLIAGAQRLDVVTLTGATTPVTTGNASTDYGWITSAGSVYAVTRVNGGAPRLHVYGDEEATLLAEGELVAIPAHDFDGAWITTRDARGTTLLRHRAGATETMWTDASAPPVEALHAGSSGNTLLIQLEHARAASTSRSGVALATWRTGQPAPRSYDVLLGRMTPWRGFAHLDVDAAIGGAPFFFDTSFNASEEPLGPSAVPMAIAGSGGADVVQEWGVVRASLEQRLLLPHIARLGCVTGRRGRQRHGSPPCGVDTITDLTIYNPTDAQQKVTLQFGSLTETLTLAAREVRALPDAVQTLFKLANAEGPLYLTPETHAVANSRTYQRAKSGTSGFSMPAFDAQNVTGPRFPAVFGASNATGLLRARTIAVDGVASLLLNDRITGDTTWFPPDPGTHSPYSKTIPLIAHTATLRSDVYLTNTSPVAQVVELSVKPLGTDQWPRDRDITLQPFEARVVRDPLQTMFDLDGLARLRFTSQTAIVAERGRHAAVRVTSRLYTIREDGGTYGTAMPPLNMQQQAARGQSLEIVTSLAAHLRLNVGIVDSTAYPEGATAKVRVTLFDGSGRSLDRFDLDFNPAQGVLLEDIFGARRIAQPAAARVLVEVLETATLVGAFATVTDVATGDPAYVAAQLGGR